jgi:hypothetical protein
MKILFNILLNLVFITASTLASADIANDPIVPKAESTFAKNFLERAQAKDFTFVKEQLDVSLIDKVSDQNITEFAKYFPTGKLLSTDLIGSQVNIINDAWQGNFTYEYHFEQGWALANAVINRKDNKLSVIGFNVYPTKASQKEINKFSLTDKSILHYLALLYAVLIPIFILITLVICIKTSIPRRKWLWIIFILGGISTFSINWTTGEYGFRLIQYQLLGSGIYSAGEYAPWIIVAGFPLGAILFWFKREKWRVTPPTQNTQEESSASRLIEDQKA